MRDDAVGLCDVVLAERQVGPRRPRAHSHCVSIHLSVPAPELVTDCERLHSIDVPKDAEVVWKRGGVPLIELEERDACALLVRRQSRPDSIADMHCYTKILKVHIRI